MIFKLLIVLAVALTYTIVRYILVGPFSWTQLPFFLMNKTMAFSSAIILFLVALNLVKQNQTAKRFWIKCLTGTVILHVLITLPIFSSVYFPRFFTRVQDLIQLTWRGGLSLLCGVLAFYTFTRNKKGQPPRRELRLLTIILALVTLHVFFMEYFEWHLVNEWFGHLPPITLLSELVVLGGLVLVVIKRFRKTGS